MISKAIALHTFQQHHWIRVSLFGVILLFVFLTAGSGGSFPLVHLTPLFVWILGAGIIGRDVASGVAHLLFTRPLSRPSYILTKWVSLTASVWVFQLSVLLVWTLGNLAGNATFDYDMGFLQSIGLALWMAATLSSVVIFFSSILPGLGDIALLLYVHVVLGIFGIFALATQNEALQTILKGVFFTFWPGMQVSSAFAAHSEHLLGYFIGESLLALLFIALAILIFSRKDISYTAD
jgi:ABC-type transport system involved in multi-copper enzyme maturation permease subunit